MAKKETIMAEVFCGKCGSVLYGYDEIICPVCGCFEDFNNPIVIK
jgi:uncharacterized Zn finger protein (UPF0148 family)